MKQLTALESRSVSVEVQNQYQQYYDKLRAFCQENDTHWPLSTEEADELMADYLDCLFIQGKTAGEGEKSLASLEFHDLKFKGRMPRSKRALRGWREAVPPQSRLPLPRLAMYGIVMQMLSRNKRSMGLMTIASFDLYLRPGEALDLRQRHIVPPVIAGGCQFQWVTVIIRDQEGGVPDKIGVFDNALAINSKEMLWMGNELLSHAKKLNHKDDMLFNFNMDSFREEFARCGRMLNLGEVHPYQLRHGGATHDLTSGRRDHSGVKARGRWKTDQSVRRYAKTGRVQQLLNQMSAAQISYCRWSEQNIAKVCKGVCRPDSTKTAPLTPWDDLFSCKSRPRRFALEIFAGTARVAAALHEQKIDVFPIDTCLFPSHNVLDPHISDYISNLIRQHRITLIWLGMPCTTFSRARRNDGLGPGPLRDSNYLWGLPNLRPSERKKLFDGNNLFGFTMHILELCNRYHIPFVLENPLTSMAWEMQPLQRFKSQSGAMFCDLDFCQFGEIWKKPTRLMYKGIDISSLGLKCTGTIHRCSRTHRQHLPLKGRDASGQFWTLRAQPYPLAMCKEFASVAARALRG